MNKLFLFDAYALIYRAYYAFIKNPRRNSKGLNTSAIMGFINTLNEVQTKEKPTHIGVAFDPSGPTFRHIEYPEYKAQREACPEDIKAAVPIIKEVLDAYHIPVLEVAGYEADDVIGTIATKAGKAGVETYMLTPDKDYGQLVTDNVYMYRPRHDGGYEVMNPESVITKYGLDNTSQVIDLLGLMGDSSDNIPGCPGVGEKTAVKLIKEFGNIDTLLQNTDKLKGALKKKVEENGELIRMSRYLATIKTDAPIELDLKSLEVVEPDNEKLEKLFEELEFKTFAKRILKKDKQEPKKQNLQLDLFSDFPTEGQAESEFSSFETIKSIAHDYKLVDNEEEMKKLCDYFLTKEILSLDTETTSVEAINAKLVGLSFSVKENEAFYVPVPQDEAEARKIVEIFRPAYEDEKILKIGQNLKYDYEVLMNYGVEIKGKMFDTMIAHYVIQPELHHNMDYLAEIYLNYQTIHIDELIGPKGKGQKNMSDLDPKDVYEYAAEDADVTLKLKNKLEAELRKYGAEELFYNIEMPLMPVLAEMEMNGVLIDTKSLAETSTVLTKRMEEVEREIYELAGGEFNIASPRQVGEVLFDKLKIVEKAKKTKKGQYVTNEEVLQSLKGKHKIVGAILEHR